MAGLLGPAEALRSAVGFAKGGICPSGGLVGRFRVPDPDHHIDPLQIAQLAADAGVRVYPVGIGSPEGAILQIDGYNILSQLDERTLQEIAAVTNGTYYTAGDDESLREIYRNVDLQLRVRGEKMEVTALLAGLGTLLLLAGGVLSLFWYGRMPL